MKFIDIAYAMEEAVEQTAVHGAEVAQDAGLLASLGIDWKLFIFQLINFGIVFLILWFLILKPLTKKLEERKDIIDESLEKANKIDEALRKTEIKYQEKIDQAKSEANIIAEQAHINTEKMVDTMKVRAKKDVEDLVTQARLQIQSEREDMMIGVKKEVVELVMQVTEKIIKEKMDEKKDKKIIEDSLGNFKA
ncbi:MAG: F0F1 ATP synthase subunit B [Candidatus Magasanikbacteria bacterium]